MANGTDTTVIYMIVVLLAVAEQVIAIVAGCAPVVSVWVVRKVLNKETGVAQGLSPAAAANHPRTLTQQLMQPGRETHTETPQERRLRKWKRSRASDPYPTMTTRQSTASEEALDPHAVTPGDVDSLERSETWEMGKVASASGKNDAKESSGSVG